MEALRRENEVLREKVALLESSMRVKDTLPKEWMLSPMEDRLVRTLMALRPAPRDAIMVSLYGTDCDDPPQDKIIDVMVSRVRRKLRPFGYEIRNVYGVGYELKREKS